MTDALVAISDVVVRGGGAERSSEKMARNGRRKRKWTVKNVEQDGGERKRAMQSKIDGAKTWRDRDGGSAGHKSNQLRPNQTKPGFFFPGLDKPKPGCSLDKWVLSNLAL